MKYAVKLRGYNQWLCDMPEHGCPQWYHRTHRETWNTREQACAFLDKAKREHPNGDYADGHVVRILSHDEAKRKAAAVELYRLADALERDAEGSLATAVMRARARELAPWVRR